MTAAVVIVVAIAIDDAVGASKGNAVGISPVPLGSFVASTMLLLTLIVMMAMVLKRLGGF